MLGWLGEQKWKTRPSLPQEPRYFPPSLVSEASYVSVIIFTALLVDNHSWQGVWVTIMSLPFPHSSPVPTMSSFPAAASKHLDWNLNGSLGISCNFLVEQREALQVFCLGSSSRSRSKEVAASSVVDKGASFGQVSQHYHNSTLTGCSVKLIPYPWHASCLQK